MIFWSTTASRGSWMLARKTFSPSLTRQNSSRQAKSTRRSGSSQQTSGCLWSSRGRRTRRPLAGNSLPPSSQQPPASRPLWLRQSRVEWYDNESHSVQLHQLSKPHLQPREGRCQNGRERSITTRELHLRPARRQPSRKPPDCQAQNSILFSTVL